jgi:hypothetical protein
MNEIIDTAWNIFCTNEHYTKIDNTHLIKLPNGKQLYEDLQLTKGENFKLRYIKTTPEGLKVSSRWIPYNQIIELIPIEK